MKDKLEEYLNNRGLEIVKRAKPLEITEDESLLVDVAGVWKEGKEEIKLVIQARCDKIREKLILNCMPYEVVILRQELAGLGGILEDFENIYTEFGNRELNKNKPKSE